MEAKDAPKKITNETIEEARRIDAWLRGAMSKSSVGTTEEAPARYRKEAYRSWLVPFVRKHAEDRSPEDIARMALRAEADWRRTGKSIPSLPKQFKSVLVAVEKILAEPK